MWKKIEFPVSKIAVTAKEDSLMDTLILVTKNGKKVWIKDPYAFLAAIAWSYDLGDIEMHPAALKCIDIISALIAYNKIGDKSIPTPIDDFKIVIEEEANNINPLRSYNQHNHFTLFAIYKFFVGEFMKDPFCDINFNMDLLKLLFIRENVLPNTQIRVANRCAIVEADRAKLFLQREKMMIIINCITNNTNNDIAGLVISLIAGLEA